MKKNQSAKKGFTLIELIVVIAILGILAAVLLPKFSGFTDNARRKSAMSEAKNCYSAAAAYYAEEGKYPTDVKELKSLSTELQGRMTFAAPPPTAGDQLLFTYKGKQKVENKELVINVSENGTLKDTTSATS